MPIYEYRCQGCGKRHELLQRHNDTPPAACPDCGGEMKKLVSSTSFVLKGTGWYKTDYASSRPSQKDSAEKDGKKAEAGEKVDTSATDKTAESKTVAKTETKAETPAKT